jgi:hypothetical protein
MKVAEKADEKVVRLAAYLVDGSVVTLVGATAVMLAASTAVCLVDLSAYLMAAE